MVRINKKLRRLYDVYIKRDQKRIDFYKYLDEGGELLRLDYSLDAESLVIDAGGYIGDFAADVANKFGCRVDIFEPVERYAAIIRERFKSNGKICVIQAGFGALEREELISIEGLGSSVYDTNGAGECVTENIRIISAVEYIQSKDYSAIDLIKINIEGGEYELLNSLLEYPDLVKRVKYFQIQFHDFIPNAHNMKAEISERLHQTHDLMWDFPFIWESWKLKT